MGRIDKRGGIARKLTILVVIVAALVTGLYTAHRYQKSSTMDRARSEGLRAYEEGDYLIAGRELGRYLKAVPEDVDILLKYADAQLRIRPRTEGAIRQAIGSYEQVLRVERGHPSASEQLSELYLLLDNPIDAERVARLWIRAHADSHRAHQRLITTMLEQNDEDKTTAAIDLARERFEKHSDVAGAALAYADALVAHDDVTQAEEVLRTLLLDADGKLAKEVIEQDLGLELALRLTEIHVRIGTEAEGERQSDAYRKAEQLYTQIVSLSPETMKPLLAKARFHLLKRWPQEEGGDAPSVLPWRNRVREALTRASQREDKELASFLELATLWYFAGNIEQGESIFRKAIETHPGDPTPFNAWSECVLALGIRDQARVVADLAMSAELGGQRLDILLPAMELYYLAERAEDATRCAKELSEKERNEAVLAYAESLHAWHQGDIEEALSKTSSSLATAPHFTRALRMKAHALRAMGRLAEAEEAYRAYLRAETFPLARVRAQLDLAELLSQQDKHSEALALVSAVARDALPIVFSEVGVSLFNIKVVAAEEGGREVSEPMFLEELERQAVLMLEAMPENMLVLRLAARVQALRGNYAEVSRLLDDSAQERSVRLPSLVLLADLLARADRYGEALEAYRAALALTEENDQRRLLRFRTASMLKALGKADECVEVIEQVVSDEEAPGPELYLDAARLLANMDQSDRAYAMLERGVARFPDHAELWVALLNFPPSENRGLTRQQIVNRLREIEGDQGLEWQRAQARIWLDQPDWRRHEPEIKRMLSQCVTARPDWVAALVTYADYQAKAGRTAQALETYREAFRAGERRSQYVAERALPSALAQRSWTDVRAFLRALPEEEPRYDPYRVALERQFNPARAESMLVENVEDRPEDWVSRLELARIRTAQGRHEDAQTLLNQAARIAPEEPQVLTVQVRLLLEQGQPEAAVKRCTQVIEASGLPEAYALRGSAYNLLGDRAKAEADLRRVAETEGWEERGHLGLGEFFLSHGKREVALSVWQEGLNKLPGNLALRQAIVELLLRGEDREITEGRSRLDQLIQEFPRNEELLTLKGQSLEREYPRRAEEYYLDALELNDRYADALRRMAFLSAQQGNREQALTYAQRCLQTDSEDMETLLLRAQLLARDDPAVSRSSGLQAADVARRALRRNPDNGSAVMNLAKALRLAGQASEALKAIEAYLDVVPKGAMSEEVRFLAIEILLNDGQVDEAAPHLEALEATKAEEPRLIQARLFMHAQKGEWDQLVTTAERFAQNHPEVLDVPMSAVELLMESSEAAQRERGVRLADALARRASEHDRVQAFVGRVLIGAGRTDEAVARLRRAIELNPSNLDALNNLAWLLSEEKDDPESAYRLLAPVIESSSSNPIYPYLLDTWGMVLLKRGQKDEAAEAFRRCIQDWRTDSVTQAVATLGLAKTYMERDVLESRRLLQRLRAGTQWENLPEDIQAEVETLLEQANNAL